VPQLLLPQSDSDHSDVVVANTVRLRRRRCFRDNDFFIFDYHLITIGQTSCTFFDAVLQ